jgi:hypothetical protein
VGGSLKKLLLVGKVFITSSESRLEGGWISKSEIYKLKAQLQAGLALEMKLSLKERAKTNQPKK